MQYFQFIFFLAILLSTLGQSIVQQGSGFDAVNKQYVVEQAELYARDASLLSGSYSSTREEMLPIRKP